MDREEGGDAPGGGGVRGLRGGGDARDAEITAPANADPQALLEALRPA